jgi:class 3 adenylate cyclase
MDLSTTILSTQPRLKLEAYAAEIHLDSLTVGTDNIHYDVFLSPRFVEFSRKYLLDLVRQTANVSMFYGDTAGSRKPPETGKVRKMLTDLLQGALTRAKYDKNIEQDLLLRLGLLKYLTAEIGNQFSSLVVECKDWIRSRGAHFEHGEQAHILRARIAELQANRKNIYREVGQSLVQMLREIEEGALSNSRRALFGKDFAELYELLHNRLLFVEGGSDDQVFLEHYVLLGNFLTDQDRFEVFESLMLDFIRDFVAAEDPGEEKGKASKAHDRLLEQARAARAELARFEEEQAELLRKIGGEDDGFAWPWKRNENATIGLHKEQIALRERQAELQRKIEELAPQLDTAKGRVDFLSENYRNRLGDYMNEPENARRLLGAKSLSERDSPLSAHERLLDEWISRLEERDLLIHMLASYEIRNLYRDYCPPIHLQQLKKSLVVREEAKRVDQILQQFPARSFSMKRIEEASRSIRRYPREEVRVIALRFAEDLMRLRRDRRNYQHVTAWMERINLVRSERSRELSRANSSLYEMLLSDEARPIEDPVVSHAIIKADVRGSTQITKLLQSRGLNPASHFSLNLYEPVKRILERYGAAKVFLEGDAIILAIYETESTRATQRAVAKACVLAREILAVAKAYNSTPETADLPRLELGLGVAFQNSAPSTWMDGDSRILISRAINLSDRLSSCSKVARRKLGKNPSPFNVFLLETVVEGTPEEDRDELLLRYNLNGISLNEEGFAKLTAEISLKPLEGNFPLPWGKERVQLFFGEVPIGDSLEPLVLRRGFVRRLEPDGNIGAPGTRAFYEVCTHPKLIDLARNKFSAPSPR